MRSFLPEYESATPEEQRRMRLYPEGYTDIGDDYSIPAPHRGDAESVYGPIIERDPPLITWAREVVENIGRHQETLSLRQKFGKMILVVTRDSSARATHGTG